MDLFEDTDNSLKCRVIFLGESETKKNGIINRLSGNHSFNGIATPGSNFVCKTIFLKEENKYINYEIWDIAGQEKFRTLARVFYKNTDVFILVYDITNYKSFDELKNYWIKQVLDSSPKNIMLVIVANKHDLIDKKEIDDDIGKNFAKEINADFYMISAKIFNAVKEMFMDLVKKYTSGNHASFADDNNNSLDFKRIRKESVKSVKISRKKSVKKVKHKCC